MQSKLMMPLVVVLPILLAGCQQTATGVTEVCAVWRPVSWSQKDTPLTIDEVKANNHRRKAWCQR